MKSKEEIIKEAWGDHLDLIKNHIDENGWIDTQIFSFARKGIEFDFCKKRTKSYLGYYNRPKSIQGIENNNNWIKIESEDDLPNDGYVFWIMRKGLDFPLYRYVDHFSIQEKLYWMESYTHYQPIQKPKPPIY